MTHRSLRTMALHIGIPFALVACGGTSASLSTFDAGGSTTGTSSSSDAGLTGSGGSGGTGADGGGIVIHPVGSSDGGGTSSSSDAAAPAPTPVVYAHSSSELYKLDPASNAITDIGTFGGCSNVIDLALDENSNAYVTTYDGFYSLNTTTAACTLIASGNSYPNSLSFVPKGTISASAETLVGYVGAEYISINTTTGAMTNVGSLSSGYTSSGDIVSVIGGGTFLTVKSTNCSDCLLQVDPTTGNLVQNYGSVNHSDVFGLAYWGGVLYGVDNTGDLFSITFPGGTMTTTNIPVPNAPSGLSFWGAGLTTAAPAASPDGGTVPIQQPQ